MSDQETPDELFLRMEALGLFERAGFDTAGRQLWAITPKAEAMVEAGFADFITSDAVLPADESGTKAPR